MITGRLGVSAASLVAGFLAVGASASAPAHPSRPPMWLGVQPFPDTPDASPQTHIGFPASSVSSVTVRGSRSGLHRGRLVALPQDRRAIFIPTRPFVDGDRVSVRATLRGATEITFSFVVKRALASKGTVRGPRAHAVGGLPVRSFHSAPSIHPPIVWTFGRAPDQGAGDIFTNAAHSIQSGPMILNPQGRLIWFAPLPNRGAAYDVELQRYQGQSVLTFTSNTEDLILDHYYHPLAAVHAGNGYQTGLHEFQITPQGNALITAYARVHADLSSIGGPHDGTLIDDIIQEIDIATGQVLWEWHAYGHVHLNESYAGKPGTSPYDFFHINSIQPLSNGNLLVSARNTWALYEINMSTGRIRVVIGGKHSSFKIVSGANFEWQHDARMQPNGNITLFDNGAGLYASEPQSRALRIRLNSKTHTVSLVHAYTHSPPLLSYSQGSVQVLPDGNTFVGFGSTAYFTEFGRGGSQLFSAHYGRPLQSYRTLRFHWWGQPTVPPSVAATATAQGTKVYASWNGATAVARWRVLAGGSQTALTPIGSFAKTDFETATWVRSTQPYFAVQALDSAGNVLGTSAPTQR